MAASIELSASSVPSPVLGVLQALRAAGHQAFLAGGAVRDLVDAQLHGRRVAPQDFDVATDALPQAVAGLFAKVIPTGIDHGTVTVLTEGHPVEVTTFRGEGPYEDGRRPSAVTFLGDLEADLARRDFTVNAIAWDPLAGRTGLRDPFGGIEDLRRRRLRAVGDAHARFSEDGLRPLRAVRFACTLRLALVPQTRRAIGDTLPTFRKVAQERVRDELQKLLVRGAPPSRGLRLLLRTGLLSAIAPELLEAVGFAQNRWHAYDVWRHTLRCVDATPAQLPVRLAALLHDVAKPRSAAGEPGERTFYNHEHLGADLTTLMLERLRLPRQVIDRVSLLVREHNWHYLPEWTDATCRRVIARVGPEALEQLWALRRADLLARGRAVAEGLENQAQLEARFAQVLSASTALRVTDLAIGGRELSQALGIAPGPQIGVLLRALLQSVMEEPTRNAPDQLLSLAKEELHKMSTARPQPSGEGAREERATGRAHGPSVPVAEEKKPKSD